MKWFIKSKTFWINLLMVVAAILDLADVLQLNFLSEEMWAFIIGSVNIVLRFLTGQPVQVRKPEAS
jgi:hypothetical protein